MLNFVEFLSSSDEEERDEFNTKTKDLNNEIFDETNVVLPKHIQPSLAAKQNNQQKKKMTVASIKQLKTHIISLEKEKRSQLFAKRGKSVKNPYAELEETENKLNNQRQKEYDMLVEGLQKTTSKLEKFKHDKTSAQQNPSSLEKLKVLMEEIESNMMQIKEKQKLVYEDLMVDEKSLSADLEMLSKKFENWSTCRNFFNNKKDLGAKKNANEDEEQQQPEEVILFERFLQATGGHLGGWDDIDHQTFIRLQKQYKKKEQLLSKAMEDIPTQCEEDILQHMEWYEKYCVLRERKREAIRNWRKLKQNEKDNLFGQTDVLVKEEEKRRKREELFEKERHERREKLHEWKTRKQEELDAKEKENERIKEENERLKYMQILEEKKRLETKIQIQEYKLKKREEEDILRQLDEQKQEQKQQISQLELDRIKERNEQFLSQKSARKMSVKIAEEQKEERLRRLKEKVVVNVERDPNRLLRPTEGWKRRKDGNDQNVSKNGVVTGARSLPHRAVPSWRQGMM